MEALLPDADEERVNYAPKVGVKCQECGHAFDAVKCPSCGAVDHSHALVRFGELVDARTIPLVGAREP